MNRYLHSLGYLAEPFALAHDLLGAVDYLEPGCILLDARLSDADAFDILATLTERRREFPVVMVDPSGSIAEAVRAMRGGAIDVLTDVEDRDAIAKILDHASALLVDRVGQEARIREAKRAVALLTSRELSVLRGLLAGKTNKEVGSSFGISNRTVDMHRANLMRKVDVNNLAELTRVALLSGLVSLESPDWAA